MFADDAADSRAVAPGADNNPIVNITGYVHADQQRYLSAERFADLYSSIDCPSNQISFTFATQDGFNSAQERWGWVNNGNRSVIIVLEAGTCSNEKRQPYLAQSVTYDSTSRQATFKAAISNWQASAPGYRVIADTQGIIDDASDASLQRRISVDSGINLDHDFSGNIFSAPDVANSSLEFNLDCKACSTSGTLNFRFDASLDLGGIFTGGDVFKASADVRPSGVGANVELGFRLGGELTSALSFNPSLPPFVLPGGISAGPLVIGPNLVVSYLAELSSVSAEAELSIGTKITIDDAAVASIGIAGGENTFDGWTPSFEQIGPDLSASVSVSAQTGPQISIELDVTVFDRGLAAGFVLAAPQLTATLSADASTAGGICDNPNADLGATIDVGLSAEFAAFGGVSDPNDKFPNRFPLFSTSQALFSTCETFGGGAAPTSSAAASPRSSAAVSQPASASASVSQPASASASASSVPAAPTGATGRTTTFSTDDCTGSSGSNGWTSGVCTPAGLNADFVSGSITGDALNTVSGCIATYYSDDTCATQVGPAFQPSSGDCISAANINDPNAAQIVSVLVEC